MINKYTGNFYYWQTISNFLYIIVLLILAGIALNLTIGENGLFTRAQDAANTWRNAEANEQLALGEGADLIDEYLNGNKDNPSTGITTVDTVPIPDGFYYAGGSKDTGLVISDNPADKKEFSEETKTDAVPNTLQGNQFVWVPVEIPSNYFIDAEATLNTAATGTEEENKVKTNVYSKLTVRSGDASDFTASNPGDTTSKSVREPDVLSTYDTDEQYHSTILNFASPKAMAESFVAEYKAMSDSIKKYKGFFIGRYELTGTVKSTMIYGVQWDATMDWLKQNEFNTDTDSSSWGNYGSRSKIDTGSDTKYEAKGIFDLAGNCYEWTQEAISSNYRVVRRW